MKAREIMTKDLITIEPDTNIPEIVRKMSENGISGLPVVEGDKIVGMVTESDIMKLLEFHDFGNYMLPIPFDVIEAIMEMRSEIDEIKQDFDNLKSAEARDIMTKKLVIASPEDHVTKVSQDMIEKKINRIPVIENNKLVGIVARSDVLKALSR